MNCPECQEQLKDSARFCSNCGLSFASFNTPTERADAFGEDQTLTRPDPLIGHVLDSKYELLARLGEGGMGMVYRARRTMIGDEVAIKVLLKKFVADTDAVERFRREARAAAMLRHPNVVTIHDFGEARGDDAPGYIVMELVEGVSLRDLIRREKRIGAERAVSLMRGICAGVGAAHRRNIWHRDLKPDNVIVLAPDEDREAETVKVVDFGIAKLRDLAAGPTLTQTGVVMGTPYYMSPEQCRGESLDARSDVYSLGAILYEMLAGSPPFMANNSTGVITKHLMESPPQLPNNLEVPPELEATMMRALAKDAQDRQPDATAFARELQSALVSKARTPTIASKTTPSPQPARPGPPSNQHVISQETRGAPAQATPPGSNVVTDPISLSKLGLEPGISVAPRRSRFVLRLGIAALLVLVIGGIVWLTLRTADKHRASATGGAPAGSNSDTDSPTTEAPKKPETIPVQPGRSTSGGRSTVTNQIGLGLVYVPAGSFVMGSPASETQRSADEGPQHRVTIADGFYMGKYEVTQAQWQQVMGSNPASFKGDSLPVEGVSWSEAQEFIRKLNAMNDGYVYRLPTEAEWEYACRAGTTTEFAFGSSLSSEQANFDGNYPYGGAAKGVYRQKTTPVGTFQPNAFGLHDMHGNVWEWCEDWSHESYDGAPADGSAWLSGGEQKYRVLRGGSWYFTVALLRSADRFWNVPGIRSSALGFRVVAVVRTP